MMLMTTSGKIWPFEYLEFTSVLDSEFSFEILVAGGVWKIIRFEKCLRHESCKLHMKVW